MQTSEQMGKLKTNSKLKHWKLNFGKLKTNAVRITLESPARTGASSESKTFIFRIESEQPHHDLLLFYRMLTTKPKSNTTAGRRVRFRPVGQQAIDK